jgi:diguanylate cyclase (GGDEF)-like protein
MLGEEEGLPHGGANVLMVDREGSLWTGGDGVHRLLGRFLWTGYTRRQGLPAHIVWSIARSRDGLLWAGTASGLAVGDGQGWRVLPGTSQRQFMSFAEDPKGNLWAGTTADLGDPARLYLRRAGASGVVEVLPIGLKADEVVTALAWDPRGFLWLGGNSDLYRLESRNGAWKVIPERIPGWPQGPNGVYFITIGPQGTIWVAASEGLAQWDGDRWRTLGKAQGLEDPVLMSVAAEGIYSAWIAFRNEKTLCRVGLKDGQLAVLATYRSPHPLAANPITSLRMGERGVLWLGTSLGVKRWDGQNLERFGRDWGLPGEDCAQNALWIDPNGDVWAGLSVGIGRYNAAADLGPSTTIPSEITAIQDGQGLSYPISPTGFKVPWRWRTLTFSVTSLSYLNESSLRRQVRLVGFEEEWRDVEGREARYTGLPAGAFTFELRSGRKEKTWGPVVTQSFVILKPWWQTWAFYGLLLVISGWLLRLGIIWRERILRQRMVELEFQVHERTWDLEEANKALEEASMVDPLTGLKNRRFLRLAIPEAEARSVRVHRHSQEQMALGEDILFLLVDLDHFKQVNDTYGHAAGDAVLQQVAELLRSACRESDTLVRWGGEEFLLVASGADRFTAAVIAENICDRFRSIPFHLPGGQDIHLTCSVGFTAFPLLPGYPTAHPWEGAVEVADQCLYAAKKSGRDGWVGAFRGDLEAGEALRERLPQDVAGLVRDHGLTLLCSFPKPEALVWADETN